jgi:hypothetical protein
MEPTFFTFPQFVANQVLKKDHLNDLFGYLDEQNRLTRTNLIGIGIVCGLDVIPDNAGGKITVTRGCGVTSEGYLIALPQAELTRRQVYKVPERLLYPPLYDAGEKKNKYDLWELLPSGDGTALTEQFWRDKVVLVFVELREENLKNCSPYSCDDRGSVVEITYRYLLIRQTDADQLKKELLAVGGTQTAADLVKIQQARAQLPEIRLKRFDVPRKSPAIFTTAELIEAFRDLLPKTKVDALKEALTKTFDVFKPLLNGLSDTPLQQFATSFTYTSGKLSLTDPLQYPYYYDFLSDLLEAYNEIRVKGLEIISVCCPDKNLFPRHLMLGKASEDTTQTPSDYRDYFLYSPLFSRQKSLTEELRALFRRLIRMLETFAVPQPKSLADTNFVRITPSRLGPVPLSEKAIPFYFAPTTGSPALYETWNPERTRQAKAKNTLTYHADQYPAPVEDFVRQPLEYDLEPYNFFRVEGHVGLHWYYALFRILSLRNRNRLPFDVVALRTGRNFRTVFDWHTHQCYFQDLEAQFGTLKEELRCLLCKEIRYLYSLPFGTAESEVRTPSKVPFLLRCQPGFTYAPNTWGHLYENRNQIGGTIGIINRVVGAGSQVITDLLLLMQKIMEVGDALDAVDNLTSFNLDHYKPRHQDLIQFATERVAVLREILKQATEGNTSSQPWMLEDLIDHIDFIVHSCKLDALESLVKTYRERVEALQRQLLFGNYAQKNPGLNHKAGVPVGGTLVLVYAGSDQEESPPRQGNFRISGRVLDPNRNPLPGVNIVVKNTAQGSVSNASGHFTVSVTQLPATLVAALGGLPTSEVVVNDEQMLAEIVLGAEPSADPARVPDNIVLADFYLPYLCCSDCPPVYLNVQGGVPEEPEPVEDLVARPGQPQCDEDGRAFSVSIQISGGTPPYTANGQTVEGASHTEAVKSGSGGTVVITDSADQQVTVEIPAHECPQPEEPCDLPCEGRAERCRYPLWLPKPSPNNRLILREVEEAGLVIRDQENDKEFQVDFRELYQDVLQEASADDFDERMQKFTDILNEMIASELGDVDTFLVGYDAENRLLTIEHYVCHTFRLSIRIRGIMSDKEYRISARYTENDWLLRDELNQQEVAGKKFGCENLDKCRNTTEAVCKEELKPENTQVTLRVNPNGGITYNADSADNLEQVVWILENGQPLFSQTRSGQYMAHMPENSVWFLGVRDDCFLVRKTTATNG